MSSHEKYLELCAALTAGELSPEEQKILEDHLAECALCRRAKHEFEITVQSAVPALVEEVAPNFDKHDASWSLEEAETALFRRLDSGEGQTLPADKPLPNAVADFPG